MSRRKKIEKIHQTIMYANTDINILSQIIENYTYGNIENQICANIINEKSRKISRANEKLSKMFKL